MSRTRCLLSQAKIKKHIFYDPETGQFFRKLAPSRRYPTARMMPTGYLDGKGYIRLGFGRTDYLAHRIAWIYMTGEWPEEQIDHADCNKANNRWSNLRESTASQNQANTPLRKNNGVGLKGASPWRGRWQSRICVNRKSSRLGIFDTPEEAHAAYAKAAREIRGEFARIA